MILWLLSLFCSAVLACYIAYDSTLIQEIKTYLRLSDTESQIKWRKFMKPFGWFYDKLRELLNCPFCLSFWLGLICNYYLWHISIVFSIVYALLSVAFVEVYRKLTLN